MTSLIDLTIAVVWVTALPIALFLMTVACLVIASDRRRHTLVAPVCSSLISRLGHCAFACSPYGIVFLRRLDLGKVRQYYDREI